MSSKKSTCIFTGCINKISAFYSASSFPGECWDLQSLPNWVEIDQKVWSFTKCQYTDTHSAWCHHAHFLRKLQV